MSALTGFRVLELTASVKGEYTGKLLTDFGADVIKVESPQGSPTRYMGPFASHTETEAGKSDTGETSGLFAYLNTGKRSLMLDSLSPESGALPSRLHELLTRVDVLLCDQPAQWLNQAGLDLDAIQRSHPQLVICMITPFGLSAGNTPATDLTVFHSSGWGYHTPSAPDLAKPPLKGAGRFMASYETGLDAALCIVAALFARQQSGQGELIDVSMQSVLVSRTDYVMGQMVAGDMPVSTERTAFDLAGPASIFSCADGFVYIWMSAPAHWQALSELMSHPEWMKHFPQDWLEKGCTEARVTQVRGYIGEWLRSQNKESVSAAAQQLGLIMVPVNNAGDLQASPQFQHRQFFAEVDHPVQGKALYPTAPYKLSQTPTVIASAAPLLGQHNDAILAELNQLPSMGQIDACAAPIEHRAEPKHRGGPLQGVRVVELTKVWAGPYTGKLLSYLGAEVIRVESLGSMDVTRTYGVEDMNNAPGWKAVNPQKLSVQIDMKSEAGIKLLKDLLADADILVENLRPGAIERLGLGYDVVKAINPQLIYVSMGMYGATGPLAYQTGYAPCFAALGGLSALVGYEGEAPQGMNVRYADSTFGATAAYAALAALVHRQRSGQGQFVDVSAVETISSMIGDALIDFSLNGVVAKSDGNRHADMAPHGVYPCQEGDWISLAVTDDDLWPQLTQLMGRPELSTDPRFSTLAARQNNETQLDELIQQWTRQHNAGELAEQLMACGIAASKSQSSLDLIADSHLWAREFYPTISDQQAGSRMTLGPSWQMRQMAQIVDGAPALGEHNAYVLGGILGLSEAEQKRLGLAGVIR